MKKVLSVLVAFSLLFAIALPAFAGENVDALTDAQQKEIATLVLDSIEKKGNDVETAMGRSNIKQDVISGIKDFTPYKTAYRANPDSIKLTVSLAVTAVKKDVSFSDAASGMLTTLIAKGIADTVAPQETVSAPSAGEVVPENPADDSIEVQYYVTVLSNLNYNQIKSVLVSLVGNGVITADEAEIIIKALYANGTVTLEQRNSLLEAVRSDEASTNVVDDIFQGYTPTDLAQLFRGFGDAINYITSGLADLLRSAGGSNGGSNNPEGTTNSNNGSADTSVTTPANPTDIPPTGDYAIVSVAGVALVAGIALVLTRKKNDEE